MNRESSKEYPIVPVRDVKVTREASDVTGVDVGIRVFRDKVDGVVPMTYVDLVQFEDGAVQRGLVAVVDIDVPALANLLMRLQEEQATLVVAFEKKKGKEIGVPPILFADD